MRLIEEHERTGKCNKCGSTFAYIENDLEVEYANRGLFVEELKYLKCPKCKAKLLESTRCM